jgi:hypothetical protein
LKIKLEGNHFDIIEVIEAESQAVLNPSENTTSMKHFKKWQKLWELCMHTEATYFEGDCGQ